MTEIDERRGDAVVAGELRHNVDRVFLAEPAEVERHAGFGQEHLARRTLHFFQPTKARAAAISAASGMRGFSAL